MAQSDEDSLVRLRQILVTLGLKLASLRTIFGFHSQERKTSKECDSQAAHLQDPPGVALTLWKPHFLPVSHLVPVAHKALPPAVPQAELQSSSRHSHQGKSSQLMGSKQCCTGLECLAEPLKPFTLGCWLAVCMCGCLTNDLFRLYFTGPVFRVFY